MIYAVIDTNELFVVTPSEMLMLLSNIGII